MMTKDHGRGPAKHGLAKLKPAVGGVLGDFASRSDARPEKTAAKPEIAPRPNADRMRDIMRKR